jgi:hypothetical protein
MPRINQLPVASSVAQTDVLAIDTPDKTYKVPRSILAPAPYIATIPTGQWSGSGSDRYITVTASNVTINAMLYPFYDNASAALLNGPVWVIPAAGSFTIHTSAIPSGTVTISVLLAGIVGEAQYQVLADVYSKSQVDQKIQQSTAWYSSSTSFTAAANDAGITERNYIGEALDAIKSGISSQTNNTIVNKLQYTSGPAVYAIVGKTNDNYFAGMAWSYYDQRFFVEFIYSNGSHQLKFM